MRNFSLIKRAAMPQLGTYLQCGYLPQYGYFTIRKEQLCCIKFGVEKYENDLLKLNNNILQFELY